MNVAIIPARGGSKRIPRKNIRPFFGKPVMAYSIETAKASGLFERVVVSTEDEEIAEVAQEYGADVLMRPRKLADDPSVGTQQVMAHALKLIPCDYACCIYATAPMLTVEDLKLGHGLLLNTPWSFVYVSGWYYWGSRASFIADLPLGEPLYRDGWIDIDTPEDWRKAEEMYEALHALG